MSAQEVRNSDPHEIGRADRQLADGSGSAMFDEDQKPSPLRAPRLVIASDGGRDK